jgi:transposase
MSTLDEITKEKQRIAYRWFCRLGLDGAVPDHSTFSKNRHGRFREPRVCRRKRRVALSRSISPSSTMRRLVLQAK